MCRDQIGSTQAELTATKQLYVNVCSVKGELEDRVHSLQVGHANHGHLPRFNGYFPGEPGRPTVPLALFMLL